MYIYMLIYKDKKNISLSLPISIKKSGSVAHGPSGCGHAVAAVLANCFFRSFGRALALFTILQAVFTLSLPWHRLYIYIYMYIYVYVYIYIYDIFIHSYICINLRQKGNFES